jgi:hypothetical protein
LRVALNTSTAASCLDSSLEHLDGGLDTSTAALTLHSSFHTSTAASTP